MKSSNQKCQHKKKLILPIGLLLVSAVFLLTMEVLPDNSVYMFYAAIGAIGIALVWLIILACQCCVQAQNLTTSKSETENSENNTLEDCQLQIKKLQENLMVQQKMASVGLLTGGIAHEIKNPLNFINNFARLTTSLCDELKEELEKYFKNPNEKDRDYINSIIEDVVINCQKIQEHGKRAESTVQNMLRQTRETGDTKKELVDVNALLEEYLNLAYHGMRAQHPEYNVKFEKKLNKDIPKLLAFPQSLGRVFLNLINNGMYAANEKKSGSQDSNYMPTITVSTDQQDNKIIIKIKDNGLGIAKEKQQEIFQPLFTTKPSGEGTGLGLAICQTIVVEEHHGEIKINSELGEFTEFELTIPVEQSK